MKPWSWRNRTLRLLAVIAAFGLLSAFLPVRFWKGLVQAMSTIQSVNSDWWYLVAILATAAASYVALLFRLNGEWRKVLMGILRGVYVLELASALTFRYWGLELCWATAVWGLACVATTLVLARPDDQTPRPHSGNPQFLLDLPVEGAKDDPLTRMPLVRALCQRLDKHTHTAPFTVAIYGSWGSGKTTTMKYMKGQLETAGHKTLWINAWLYDSKLAVWKAFMENIEVLLKDVRLTYSAKQSFRDYCKIGLEVLAASDESLTGKLAGVLKDHLPTTEGFERAKENVSQLISLVLGRDKRLFVFVDDLDRCSPDSLMGTLEFLKEVANFRHCTFVMGVDYDSVHSTLKERYGTKGSDYLHKVINLAVDLNQPNVLDVAALIKSEDHVKSLLAHKAGSQIVNYVIDTIGSNPRLVKQFLNRLIVLRDILRPLLGAEIPSAVLVDVELIRLKHRGVYDKLKEPRATPRLKDAHFQAFHLSNGSDEDKESAWVTKVAELFALERDEAAEVAQLLTRNIVINSFFSHVTDLSLLFSHAPAPTAVTQAEFTSFVEATSADRLKAEATIAELIDKNVEKTRAIARRVVHAKNDLLRLEGTSLAVVGTGIGTNELYRDLVLDLLRCQSNKNVQLIFAEDLQDIVAGEVTHCRDNNTVAFLRQVLMHPSWACDTLARVVLKPSFDPAMRKLVGPEVVGLIADVQQRAGLCLWADFLGALGTTRKSDLFDDESPFNVVLSLRFNVLVREESHHILMTATRQHSCNEQWIENFVNLLRWWGDFKRTVEDPARFLDEWRKVAASGFFTALKESSSYLNLSKLGRSQIEQSLAHLEDITLNADQ